MVVAKGVREGKKKRLLFDVDRVSVLQWRALEKADGSTGNVNTLKATAHKDSEMVSCHTIKNNLKKEESQVKSLKLHYVTNCKKKQYLYVLLLLNPFTRLLL